MELEAAGCRRSRGGSCNEGGEVGLPEEDRMLELTTDCDLPLLELFELAEQETVDGLRLAPEVETDLVGVEVVNSLRPLMLGLGTAMAAPEFFLGSLETGLYDSGLEGMIMVLGVAVAFFGFDPAVEAEEDEKVRTLRAVARKDLEL